MHLEVVPITYITKKNYRFTQSIQIHKSNKVSKLFGKIVFLTFILKLHGDGTIKLSTECLVFILFI